MIALMTVQKFCTFCGADASRGTGGARNLCYRHYYAWKKGNPMFLEKNVKQLKGRNGVSPPEVPGAVWIALTKGKFTLVDADTARTLGRNWHYSFEGYAIRKHKKFESMARVILGIVSSDGLEADHINGNRLDNRKSNLRIVNASQNTQNRGRNVNKTSSMFKGVYPQAGLWRAKIKVEMKQIHLGYFRSEVEAARAYNVAAEKYFGEFARLNKVA